MKIINTLLIFLLFNILSCNKATNMEHKTTQQIVKNNKQQIVAEIGIKNNKIHGLCIWYNSTQNPITCGLFNEGKPYSGTFINWSLFLPELENNPYKKDLYCKDWVTMFEISHISKEINFNHLIEIYVNGEKINQ